MRARCFQFRYTVDYIDCQCEAIDLIIDRQLHRRVDVAAFLVATHVHVLMIGPPVGEPVNQPRVAMEVEDDRLVHGEQAVKVAITQPVRMLCVACNLNRSTTLMKRIFRSGNSFRSSAVAASASCVGISPAQAITTSGSNSLIVAGLTPDTDAFRAMRDRCIHVQILQVHLLVADDHVDVVLAAQTMIGDGQQSS